MENTWKCKGRKRKTNCQDALSLTWQSVICFRAKRLEVSIQNCIFIELMLADLAHLPTIDCGDQALFGQLGKSRTANFKQKYFQQLFFKYVSNLMEFFPYRRGQSRKCSKNYGF